MPADADLECESLLGEVFDPLGLLDGIVLEPIGNPHSSTGDSDVHGSLLLLLAG
jgi:hypothetical protein